MRATIVLVLAAVLPSGCATRTKAKLLEDVYRHPGERAELFEANLQVLDRHPEWVDEFFEALQKHEATLDRTVEDQTARLDWDVELARRNARHLRAHPKALAHVMRATVDAAEHDHAARHAIAEAVKSRAAANASIILDDEPALEALSRAMIAEASRDPDERKHLREAFQSLFSEQHASH